MGKLPIDYIIESNDDDNLFSFLMFDYNYSCSAPINSTQKYFLKLKNQQYFNQTGETLFAKLYNIINKY